ncbi:MAG: hypothetical protein ACK42Y_08205 [Candidatus Thermochlorobacter sp.]
MYGKKWIVPFSILVLISVLGVFTLTTLVNPDAKPIVPADVAWMLTATERVLLMTPSLSFFYSGMVGKRNAIQ